jgi:hypothetical protein
MMMRPPLWYSAHSKDVGKLRTAPSSTMPGEMEGRLNAGSLILKREILGVAKFRGTSVIS